MAWRHEPTREGATAYGSHFFGEWDTCRRKWWLSKRAPHPTGGFGLRVPRTPGPLLVGSAVHEALAAYYISGASNGAYNLEHALDVATEKMAERASEWVDKAAYEADMAQVRSLLYDYDDFYGPRSERPDYPELEVVVDAEGPVIEREFRIPIENSDVEFTCRVDGLVRWHGWLYVLEHKTTAASRVNSLRTEMRLDLQATGQAMVVAHHYPEERVSGVLLNCLVKNRSARSKTPAFVRDTLARTEQQLEQFRMDLANRVEEMDRVNNRYDTLVDQGTDPWLASRKTFPLTGSSQGACVKWGRACDYLDLCVGVGHEALQARGYAASIQPKDETVRTEEELAK